MKKSPLRLAATVAALALLVSANAYSASTFDPTNNRLFISSVSVNGVSYQNVALTLHTFTLLGVDSGAPGVDTFNLFNNVLTLGSVELLGAIYYNVRVQLNSVTLIAATPSSTLPEASTCNLANFQTDLMLLINQARASGRTCGSTAYPAAAPLVWNNKLFDASSGHSADMAGKNYVAHNSLDGRTPGQRITAAGYNWSSFGENVAAGQNSVASVMADWLASAGHCGNIMNSSYHDVAVACVANNSSTYRTYWTMDLGKP